MIIQNEFCNAGTMEELIRTNQQNNIAVSEQQLKATLLQVTFSSIHWFTWHGKGREGKVFLILFTDDIH